MMNQNLPIWNFRNEISNTVKNNKVTIIVAETAAGKSTQVPQFLLEDGYELVVTQPRRLAARTVARRVAEEKGETLGQTVGLRTREEKVESEKTSALFCTDGLALVRELLGSKKDNTNRVLIIDEVHEWNMNIEVLVAWAKDEIAKDANFKLVLMSATLESDALSKYFWNATIINVPGRVYPVEEISPKQNLRGSVMDLIAQKRNVLVFLPGKREIMELTEELIELKVNAEILPLHGELSPEDQGKCFQHYPRPKCVISTNVAQTSVTIDDIDAVVDESMERRIELVNGVEGLYLRPISLADRNQRKGRAGRTKPGVYIDHCKNPEDRRAFPIAEINRRRLDLTVLRLAEAGFDAEKLEFFHQPDRSQIHEAREALRNLGCMDENDEVTEIGHRIARMPVGVGGSRMLIEAERLGVVDEVIDIVAILESNNPITNREGYTWQRYIDGEHESDLIAQMKVFRHVMNNHLNAKEMKDIHVLPKNYFRVLETRKTLRESLTGKFDFSSNGDRTSIMKAIIAGMVNHVYVSSGWGRDYTNGSSGARQLNKFSVVTPQELLVGVPYDLHTKGKYDMSIVIPLINFATRVKSHEWLKEVAPQLYKVETDADPFIEWDGRVKAHTVTYFKGQEIKREAFESPNHPEAARLRAEKAQREQEQRERQARYDSSPYYGYGRTTYSYLSKPVETPEQKKSREELKAKAAQAKYLRERAQTIEDLKTVAKYFRDRALKGKLDQNEIEVLTKIANGPAVGLSDEDLDKWVDTAWELKENYQGAIDGLVVRRRFSWLW